MQMTNGRLHEPVLAGGGIFASHPFPWGRIILAVGGTTLTVASMVIGLLSGIGFFNAPVLKPEMVAVKVQIEQVQSAVEKTGNRVEEIAATMNRIDGFISGQMSATNTAPVAPAVVARKRPAQAVQKKTGWSLFN
jgi:hypothetical protein